VENPLKDKKVAKIAIPVGVLALAYVAYAYSHRTPTETTPQIVANPNTTPTGTPTQEPVPVSPPSGGEEAILTDDAWLRITVERLTTAGWNTQAATIALSQYLARQPLTPAQIEIVRAGIGLSGRPPGGQYAIIPMPVKGTPSPTPTVPAPPKTNPITPKPLPNPAPLEGGGKLKGPVTPVPVTPPPTRIGAPAPKPAPVTPPKPVTPAPISTPPPLKGPVKPVTPVAPPTRIGAPAPAPVPVTPPKPVPVPVTPPKPNPAPVTPPKPNPTPSPIWVTVAKYTKNNPPWNSTLSGIARHYGTTVSAIMALNPNIKNPNLIYVGQKVRVR